MFPEEDEILILPDTPFRTSVANPMMVAFVNSALKLPFEVGVVQLDELREYEVLEEEEAEGRRVLRGEAEDECRVLQAEMGERLCILHAEAEEVLPMAQQIFVFRLDVLKQTKPVSSRRRVGG